MEGVNFEDMLKLISILRLIRWHNLLFVAFVVWLMEKMVAVPLLNLAFFGEQLPSWMLYMLMFAIVMIAAGGYAINDYFDVKIDNINRPDHLIVTRDISKREAMLVHQVTTAFGTITGLVLAWVTRSWSLALVFILVAGLMWFYSSSYKRQFIVGNLIVSFSTGLVPLTVAMVNNAYMEYHYGLQVMNYTTIGREIYVWIGTFALFAFLTTLVREIIKDLQDQIGDRELECHTIPILIGEMWTKVILTLLIFLIGGAAYFAVFHLSHFEHSWSSMSVRYFSIGLILPLLCELYLFWTARIPSDYRFAQGLMKFVMFIGVLFSIVIRVQLL